MHITLPQFCKIIHVRGKHSHIVREYDDIWDEGCAFNPSINFEVDKGTCNLENLDGLLTGSDSMYIFREMNEFFAQNL